ncbi:MAG: hypothetical protein Q4A41_02070 [Bacillota bacterium]|nr:hypothetical protein [Bacillota bacterium]
MSDKTRKQDEFEQLKALFIESKSGVLPKSLLLSGEEEYPLTSYIRQIKSVVPMPELNITEYRDVFPYDSVKNAFDVLPMMSDFRLIILNKTGYFKWNKDERFHALFSDIPDHIRLVVFETDLNKISANYKKFEKSTRKIVLEKVSKTYLLSWIKDEFKNACAKYGADACGRLTHDATVQLAERGVEKGMFFVKNAIDYFAAQSREISGAEVTAYFGSSEKNTVWMLYEKIVDDDFVETVLSLLDEGEDEFEIFGRISSLIRSGLRYKMGDFEGTPYMSKAASKVSYAFEEDQLRDLVSRLSAIDIEMKSTSASKKNLLLQAVSKIRHAKRR